MSWILGNLFVGLYAVQLHHGVLLYRWCGAGFCSFFKAPGDIFKSPALGLRHFEECEDKEDDQENKEDEEDIWATQFLQGRQKQEVLIWKTHKPKYICCWQAKITASFTNALTGFLVNTAFFNEVRFSWTSEML